MQPSQELSPADLANATTSCSAFEPSAAASSVVPGAAPAKRAARGSMLMPRSFVHVHTDGQPAEQGAGGDQAVGSVGTAGAAKHSIANSFLPPNPSMLPPAELAQLDELAAGGDPEAEALAVLASELFRQEQLLMQELALLQAAEQEGQLQGQETGQQQGFSGADQQAAWEEAQARSQPASPGPGQQAGTSPSALLLGKQTGLEEFHTPRAAALASPHAAPLADASALSAGATIGESSLAGRLQGSPMGAGSMAGSPSLQASPSGMGGQQAATALATQPPAASPRQLSGTVPPTMPPWLDEGATQVPLRRVSSALRRLVGGLPAPLPLSRLSGASVASGGGRPSRGLPSVAEQAAGAGGGAQPPLWQRNHANPSVASTEGAETVRLRRLSSALRRLVSTKLRARDLGHLAEPSEQGEPLPAEHLPSGWASELAQRPG